MELTKEKALELHRKMWTDMQECLGNNPSARNRRDFKEKWCEEHFPDEDIQHCCFLCEYACQFSEDGFEDCSRCPIVWPCEPSDFVDDYFCEGNGHVDEKNGYRFITISKLLALPERETEDVSDE